MCARQVRPASRGVGITFTAWLFVGLPALYSPSHEGFLGVKLAEWLLIGATLALYIATRQLVIGAEKTAERQLRAYLMIKTVRLEGLKSGSCLKWTPEIGPNVKV